MTSEKDVFISQIHLENSANFINLKLHCKITLFSKSNNHTILNMLVSSYSTILKLIVASPAQPHRPPQLLIK